MNEKALADLNAARKQWTERRRQLAAGMGQGSVSLSDDSLSEQFLQAQSMIEAIDRALEDEKLIGVERNPHRKAAKQ
jgi:hypothetical protein